MVEITGIAPDQPVLIAGATASGKSALALQIAQHSGGIIVNADALQVYDGWRIVTARPPAADEARAPHLLYGHIAPDQPYSVGDWLREVAPLIAGPERVIIVGGTGLYFRALTEGLAEIPEVQADIRARGDALRGAGDLSGMLADLDAATLALIDQRNPMRVQRAWEVQMATGRGLAAWQAQTPPPLLPLDQCTALHLDADRDWLNARIEQRFQMMLDDGALTEARQMEPGWHPAHPASKAIGAAELIAHIRGEMSLEQAQEAAVIATRQYAKRQRTWFRARMTRWRAVPLP